MTQSGGGLETEWRKHRYERQGIRGPGIRGPGIRGATGGLERPRPTHVCRCVEGGCQRLCPHAMLMNSLQEHDERCMVSSKKYAWIEKTYWKLRRDTLE